MTTDWRVPLLDLRLGGEERRAVQAVLDSNWITMGEVTKQFEAAFAEYLGVRHAIAVNSGTAALHLAHHALGLGPGDEVICPSLTFVATANTIVYMGGVPVFADVESEDDLTISPQDVASRITERTKGVVVVHYAGFPCDMDPIMEIARKHNLYVVEDAAHAPGAEYLSSPKHQGNASPLTFHPSLSRKLGTIGDVGCFSFFGNKNMTTGEGGMVVTDDDDLAEKIRIARSHGMTSLTWDRYKGHSFSYDVVSPGFNYRIDDLRSALGLVQLKKLDENNQRRRELWKVCTEKLKQIETIGVPFFGFQGISSHHILPIILRKGIDRKKVMEYLRTHGIQTSIHYPPIHRLSYYNALTSIDMSLPVTEEIGKREVTLPLFPTMTASQAEFVADRMKTFFNTSADQE
jgi:dTDP-4-amino-4,6-dideoxygalactose transaminase